MQHYIQLQDVAEAMPADRVQVTDNSLCLYCVYIVLTKTLLVRAKRLSLLSQLNALYHLGERREGGGHVV